MSTPAWSTEAPSSAAGKAAAAKLKHNSERCSRHADLDACNDAIRWNPSDPVLLVALADALVRAKRPADAIRHYRRAAALAPNMPGIAAKITAAEARLPAKQSSIAARRTAQPPVRAPAELPVTAASVKGATRGRYSNAAPETQSH
jgi:cytochrome c-type biogenesis protein CcmH/NrfG